MTDITFDDQGRVNIGALDETLRGALGARFFGLSVSGAQVILHLSDEATPDDIAQARAIMRVHDPDALSPSQQAEAERRARLEQARTRRGDDLDTAPYEPDPQLNVLARKIAWLEQEIKDLRGGQDS